MVFVIKIITNITWLAKKIFFHFFATRVILDHCWPHSEDVIQISRNFPRRSRGNIPRNLYYVRRMRPAMTLSYRDNFTKFFVKLHKKIFFFCKMSLCPWKRNGNYASMDVKPITSKFRQINGDVMGFTSMETYY